jgi:hypothetical protein
MGLTGVGSFAVVAAPILAWEGFSGEPEWTRSRRGGVGGPGLLRSGRRNENSKSRMRRGKKLEAGVRSSLYGGGVRSTTPGEEGEGGGPNSMGATRGGGGGAVWAATRGAVLAEVVAGRVA